MMYKVACNLQNPVREINSIKGKGGESVFIPILHGHEMVYVGSDFEKFPILTYLTKGFKEEKRKGEG